MLTSTIRKVQYNLSYPFGDIYSITYSYWLKAQIFAVLSFNDGTADQTLVLNTDYSLTAPGATGTLTKLTDWNHAAIRLTIYRLVDLDQSTDYRNGEAVDMDLLEQDFDLTVARDQQLQEQIDRIGSTPITDPSAAGSLPALSERLDKFAAWDAEGLWIAALGVPEVPVTALAATLLDDTTLLQQQKTLGLLASGASAAIAADLQAILGAADAPTALNLLGGVTLTTGNWAKIFKSLLVPGVPTPVHKGFIVAVGGTPRYANNRTNSSTSAGKLIDSGATFTTWGVTAGDYVHNYTDGTWARVTAVDSQIQVSIDSDIFLATSKTYKMWSVPSWTTMGVDNVLECDGSAISDASSPWNGMKLPDLNGAGPYADVAVIGGRFLRGGSTAGVLQEDQGQGHWHELWATTAASIAAGSVGKSAEVPQSLMTSNSVRVAATDGTNGTPRVGKESRGRTMSVVYIMRIK